jgi:copper chaperone CopZ
MTKIELKVDGMHCKSCLLLTKEALDEIGAKDIKVSLGSGSGPATVSCDYDGDKMNVITAIIKSGFNVRR